MLVKRPVNLHLAVCWLPVGTAGTIIGGARRSRARGLLRASRKSVRSPFWLKSGSIIENDSVLFCPAPCEGFTMLTSCVRYHERTALGVGCAPEISLRPKSCCQIEWPPVSSLTAGEAMIG